MSFWTALFASGSEFYFFAGKLNRDVCRLWSRTIYDNNHGQLGSWVYHLLEIFVLEYCWMDWLIYVSLNTDEFLLITVWVW